jgi:hypothetical protein
VPTDITNWICAYFGLWRERQSQIQFLVFTVGHCGDPNGRGGSRAAEASSKPAAARAITG